MKTKQYFLLAGLLLVSAMAKAQTTDKTITEHDPAVRAKDSLIKVTIIGPARKAANGQEPAWETLKATITQKYDTPTADRTITKAIIYFNYKKDWAKFSSGIVHYTNTYELATDYPLLNQNASMILQVSDNPAELEQALKWSKLAVDSDPANEKYKTTYQEIQDKIAGN